MQITVFTFTFKVCCATIITTEKRGLFMKICDLHTHSCFSDGTDTPARLIELAEGAGLSAVALCDHNNVDGLAEFLSAAEGRNIEAVAGCEFSVTYEGKELHLLGLYIPESAFGDVTALTLQAQKNKAESNARLIEALNKAGYDISYDDVKKLTPKGNFNRSHVGEVLTEKGYTASVDDAFKKILSEKSGYYKKPERYSVWQVLDFILSINAVPVLAHPFLNLDEERLVKFLPEAKKKGLAGMECMYSEYNAVTEKKAMQIAEGFGLKFSGGSDYHGKRKPGIKIAVGRGNLKIPYDWAVALKG